jgi:hypothetical protein
MGTKNNPAKFDCYSNAAPDEPMFILLGRDAMAPSLVEAWADAREARGERADKVAEARECAEAMRRWLRLHGKAETPIVAQTPAGKRSTSKRPAPCPPNAGESTCPMCMRVWLVTEADDCMMPACGCFGSDTSANNPHRPCHACGLAHVSNCERFARGVRVEPCIIN